MAQFSYDASGWFSGQNAADIAAGRVTSTDPCVVDGGPAARWTGAAWEYPFAEVAGDEQLDNLEG